MKFEELAIENAGKEISDYEFAHAIGLRFYITVSRHGTVAMLHMLGNQDLITERRLASTVEISLWEQLRHAYGFQVTGTCNSLHAAQIQKGKEEK